MSDCARPNGRWSGVERHPPRPSLEKPTLERLTKLYGDPPWEIEVPDYGMLPQEATEHVGYIKWRGILFERVKEAE